MNLDTPKKSHFALLGDIIIGIFVLSIVIALSVAIGLRLKPESLANWGGWLGASIAGLALVGSAFAIILQARQGESASWNIALARLGQVYDLAQSDEKLARIVAEAADYNLNSHPIDPDDIVFSPQETIWVGSLFLAYEQIYVATNSLRPESQRVWRLYLKNQLNKPTIRAAFIRDATNAKDYHNDFWRFVRGKSCAADPGYKDFAIHPRFFGLLDGRKSSGEYRLAKTLLAKATSPEDIDFWTEIYSDPEVKKQMYAPPLDSPESLSKYLQSKRSTFIIWEKDARIGGFTLTDVSPLIGTFGIAIHRRFRGLNYGNAAMRLLEAEANRLGYKTLRADVYCDNYNSTRLLEKSGFRKFIWLEKNL